MTFENVRPQDQDDLNNYNKGKRYYVAGHQEKVYSVSFQQSFNISKNVTKLLRLISQDGEVFMMKGNCKI